jgi:hypothetical protein
MAMRLGSEGRQITAGGCGEGWWYEWHHPESTKKGSKNGCCRVRVDFGQMDVLPPPEANQVDVRLIAYVADPVGLTASTVRFVSRRTRSLP